MRFSVCKARGQCMPCSASCQCRVPVKEVIPKLHFILSEKIPLNEGTLSIAQACCSASEIPVPLPWSWVQPYSLPQEYKCPFGSQPRPRARKNRRTKEADCTWAGGPVAGGGVGEEHCLPATTQEIKRYRSEV